MNVLQARIAELVEQHGSIRAAARVLMVDHTYLFRLSTGEKTDPGDELLRKLKLRQVVTFERIGQPAPAVQEPVAWRIENTPAPGIGADIRGAFGAFYGDTLKTANEYKAKGWRVTPLYSAPLCPSDRELLEEIEQEFVVLKDLKPWINRLQDRLRKAEGRLPIVHDYPACAIFRGGKCTCDEVDKLCPRCGTEEWDHVTAERGRERDVPFNRCNRCDNEWPPAPSAAPARQPKCALPDLNPCDCRSVCKRALPAAPGATPKGMK